MNYNNKKQILFPILGILLFTTSIIWINFHSSQWYDFDMYSDMLVAHFMVNEHTLFPNSWVFGNQYYVIATPVIAAAVNLFTKNMYFSIALASSIYTILILFIFCWSIKPFVNSPSSIAISCYIICGAGIIGTSASSYYYGFQLLYTMASYYACYLFVCLFAIGIYFRIENGINVSSWLIVLALLLDFCLGMQSLRETLVLNLPLLIFPLFRKIVFGSKFMTNTHKGFLFSFLLFLSNICGLIVINMFNIKTHSIINVSVFPSPDVITSNFRACVSGLVDITGLRFLTQGLKYKPLGTLSVFYVLLVICVLIYLIVKRDSSVLSQLIWFSLISLLGTFLAGILFITVRGTYFFIWYLLLSLCIAYLFEHVNRMGYRFHSVLTIIIVLAGIGNYIYNFYPDYSKYIDEKKTFSSVVDVLVENNVSHIYTDVQSHCGIGATANGKATLATVNYIFYDSTKLAYPVPYLQSTDFFTDTWKKGAWFAMTSRHSYVISSLEYLNTYAPPGYLDRLYSCLKLEATVSGKYEDIQLYSITKDFITDF